MSTDSCLLIYVYLLTHVYRLMSTDACLLSHICYLVSTDSFLLTRVYYACLLTHVYC